MNCGGNGNSFLHFPAETIKPCVNYAWEVTVVLGIIILLKSFFWRITKLKYISFLIGGDNLAPVYIDLPLCEMRFLSPPTSN